MILGAHYYPPHTVKVMQNLSSREPDVGSTVATRSPRLAINPAFAAAIVATQHTEKECRDAAYTLRICGLEPTQERVAWLLAHSPSDGTEPRLVAPGIYTRVYVLGTTAHIKLGAVPHGGVVPTAQ